MNSDRVMSFEPADAIDATRTAVAEAAAVYRTQVGQPAASRFLAEWDRLWIDRPLTRDPRLNVQDLEIMGKGSR